MTSILDEFREWFFNYLKKREIQVTSLNEQRSPRNVSILLDIDTGKEFDFSIRFYKSGEFEMDTIVESDGEYKPIS